MHDIIAATGGSPPLAEAGARHRLAHTAPAARRAAGGDSRRAVQAKLFRLLRLPADCKDPPPPALPLACARADCARNRAGVQAGLWRVGVARQQRAASLEPPFWPCTGFPAPNACQTKERRCRPQVDQLPPRAAAAAAACGMCRESRYRPPTNRSVSATSLPPVELALWVRDRPFLSLQLAQLTSVRSWQCAPKPRAPTRPRIGSAGLYAGWQPMSSDFPLAIS